MTNPQALEKKSGEDKTVRQEGSLLASRTRLSCWRTFLEGVLGELGVSCSGWYPFLGWEAKTTSKAALGSDSCKKTYP